MLARRIIPCLDIKDGRTVKGTNFKNLRDAGNPIDLAEFYAKNGADELVFLDITATLEKRKTLVNLVKEVAEVIDIPFTVGGGINSLKLVDELLKNGADKVTVNSAAIKNPNLINQISDKYGSQCIVVAIDAKKIDDNWIVFSKGGTYNTRIDLFMWAKEMETRGAGEILFTSMDADGMKLGFEINALRTLSEVVNVPITASGGAGSIEDYCELFSETTITGGLAASIFHFNEVDILDLKKELVEVGVTVRI